MAHVLIGLSKDFFANWAMLFDWDEEKTRSNFAKHNISFDETSSVFDDPLFLTFADPEHSLQEQRFIIMGEFSQRAITRCRLHRTCRHHAPNQRPSSHPQRT
jgi:uncharacterized protein